ncbi:MAG: amidase [Nocardioides sp.]|nr:amidase [Nocardioides sp.]
MDDYQQYDALGLAEAIAQGRVSADDVLAAAKARAAQVNHRLNAIVVDVSPPVRRESEGPFAGVPFLLKDLGQGLAGWPMSWGSRAWSRTPVAENDAVVDRWLDAGLVVFGKTNTPEFGAKGVTEPHLFGAARNPWNLDHTPGGSSGGSAAAVAAGIVPCAGANDGGGSIRIPASACGLFGLKASRGLVPAGPAAGEMMLGSAINGVVSRSVRDTAAMLDVLAGDTDVSPYRGAPATPLLDEVAQEPGRLRIAVSTQSSINPSPHPEAIAAARTTADLLRSLGHEVVELDRMPFDDAALARDFLTTWFAWCAWQVDDARRRAGAKDADFEPDTLVMAALGRATKPVDLVAAIEARHGHTRSLAAFHAEFDLLLTPTTATPPPRIGAFDQPPGVVKAQKALIKARSAGALRFTPIVEQMISQNLGWVPYTQLANLTGRPAMTVPLHWTPDGLPIGSQFVGRLGSEPVLIRLAAQLEAAQSWADKRPAL